MMNVRYGWIMAGLLLCGYGAFAEAGEKVLSRAVSEPVLTRVERGQRAVCTTPAVPLAYSDQWDAQSGGEIRLLADGQEIFHGTGVGEHEWLPTRSGRHAFVYQDGETGQQAAVWVMSDVIAAIDYEARLDAGETIQARGWKLAPGSVLPSGLTLSSDGVLSGRTDAVGAYTFAAEITDAAGQTIDKTFPLLVREAKERALWVRSDHGTAVPDVGTHTLIEGETTLTVSAEDLQGAQPHTTRYFCTGWTGTGSVPPSGTTPSVTFTLLEDSSITWNWQKQHWLSISTQGLGEVSAESGWQGADTTLTLVASPAQYQRFVGWRGDLTGCQDHGDRLSVPMDSPRVIRAEFEQIYHDFSVCSEYGSPSPTNGVYHLKEGAVQDVCVNGPVFAGSTTNYVCTGWIGTGSVPATGEGTNVTFTLLEDSSITWTWQTNYWLSISTQGLGEVSAESGWQGADTTLTLVASPAQYQRFIGWRGDLTGCQSRGPRLLVPMSQARAITAAFEPIPHTLSICSEYGVPVPTNGVYQLREGSEQTLRVDASIFEGTTTNYLCTGWIGTGSVPATGEGTNVTFTLLEDSSITWTWQTNYWQELTATLGGTLSVASGWQAADGTIEVNALAVNQYCKFLKWQGDLAGCQFRGPRILIPTDRAHKIWAEFSAETRTLDVRTPHGTPTPASGTTTWIRDTELHAAVDASVLEGSTTNYLCTGWTGTGSVPASGTETNVSFHLLEDSSIAWTWQTNYWVDLTVEGMGRTDKTEGWVRKGGSFSVRLIQDPSCGAIELRGDCGGVTVEGDRLLIPGDHARALTVYFRPLDLQLALDEPNITWTTGGVVPWTVSKQGAHDGKDVAKAGRLTTSSFTDDSWLSTTVQGSGIFRYWIKIGSGNNFGLDVYLDDNFQSDYAVTASCEWRLVEIPIEGTGPHTLKWSFWISDPETVPDIWMDEVSWTSDKTETSTPVPVPFAWLDRYGLVQNGDYEAAASATAANGQPVWACYVAGLDPTDPDAHLRAKIEMKEGRAVITWEPDLGAERVYTVEGAEALGKPWKSPPEAKDRFFRVKVRLP